MPKKKEEKEGRRKYKQSWKWAYLIECFPMMHKTPWVQSPAPHGTRADGKACIPNKWKVELDNQKLKVIFGYMKEVEAT